MEVERLKALKMYEEREARKKEDMKNGAQCVSGSTGQRPVRVTSAGESVRVRVRSLLEIERAYRPP